MEYVIRSIAQPYRYHTGDGWSENVDDAKKHPSGAIARAVIIMYNMQAEEVPLVENKDVEQPENGGGGGGQPETPAGDSGE